MGLRYKTKKCSPCKAYFKHFACTAVLGECDCPKCQGLCDCYHEKVDPYLDDAASFASMDGKAWHLGEKRCSCCGGIHED